MTRRAFVAILRAAAAPSVGLVVGTAAANPPAPSSVPDPMGATPKTGEHANRIKRHDGGCFLHFASGAVAKAECPAVLDKPGDQIERDPESGQCVLVEPWAEEPKETACPHVLVPAGFETPVLAASAPIAAKPITLAAPEPPQKTGCAGCTTSRRTDGASATFALALAAVFLRRRR
ncbi:MAG: hypothetical protein ACXVEF_23495 [Polyangiales bacterium]